MNSYPESYDETTKIAKTELQEKARPEVAGRVENFADYDVIFVGYPIWLGDLPMCVYTFLESYDFAGKIVVPFCTHEGSALGGTERFLADATKAKTLPGLAIQGKVAQSDRDKATADVESRLGGLNF